MKPFDLEAAKAGAQVISKSGKRVRIICFDAQTDGDSTLIALISYLDVGGEYLEHYDHNGCALHAGRSCNDLIMAPVKHDGWVNLHKNGAWRACESRVYTTKEEAEAGSEGYPAITVKVEWEE